MSIDCEKLRSLAEYAGLSDVQIEVRYRRLYDASTEALQKVLIERAIMADQQLELVYRERVYR